MRGYGIIGTPLLLPIEPVLEVTAEAQSHHRSENDRMSRRVIGHPVTGAVRQCQNATHDVPPRNYVSSGQPAVGDAEGVAGARMWPFQRRLGARWGIYDFSGINGNETLGYHCIEYLVHLVFVNGGLEMRHNRATHCFHLLWLGGLGFLER